MSDGVQRREEIVDGDLFAVVGGAKFDSEECIERPWISAILHPHLPYVAAVLGVRRGWNCKPCERGNGNSSCYEFFAHLSVPLQLVPPTPKKSAGAGTRYQSDIGRSTREMPDA